MADGRFFTSGGVALLVLSQTHHLSNPKTAVPVRSTCIKLAFVPPCRTAVYRRGGVTCFVVCQIGVEGNDRRGYRRSGEAHKKRFGGQTNKKHYFSTFLKKNHNPLFSFQATTIEGLKIRDTFLGPKPPTFCGQNNISKW